MNSNQAYAKMSNEDLLKRIAELEAKVEAKANRDLTFHISEAKGCIVLRGWNKQFPLSMYLSQFDRLVKSFDALKAFVAKYRANLAVKNEEWNPAVALVGVPKDVIIPVKEEKAN